MKRLTILVALLLAACSGVPLPETTPYDSEETRAFLHELSDESSAAIGRALPRVARAVKAATGAEHYNVLQNNGAPAHQAVFHVHFHVIPRIGETGLGIGWEQGALSPDVAKTLLAKMHASLDGEG